jgi:hypothetical protein
MAYLDLDNLFAAPAGSASGSRVITARTGFSALEWNVILLARNDSVASLSSRGRVARALGAIFGIAAQAPLADPRLEALRRIAVHAWRKGLALPAAEIERFVAAGFHRAQIDTLIARVTA